MSKLKFAGRKWDARNWTREQKIQWQEMVFELGYSWDGMLLQTPLHLSESFFVTPQNTCKLFYSLSPHHFEKSSGELLNFEDMFLEEQEDEKLDVIKEITELFSESIEEDERSFEGLIYECPDIKYLDYWYIPLKDLSEDQIEFLSGYFTTDGRFTFNNLEDILMYQKGNFDGEVIWTNHYSRTGSNRLHKVAFNDLFKYEDEPCSVQ